MRTKRDKNTGKRCLPQTLGSTALLVFHGIVAVTAFITLVGWLDPTLTSVAIAFDIVSLLGVILSIIVLVRNVMRLQKHNQVSELVHDIELRNALSSILIYLAIGILHFAFTVGKTATDYSLNPLWAVMVDLLHLLFYLGAIVLLILSITDFPALGNDVRRTLTSSDASMVNEQSWSFYGLFPPITLILALSLVGILILFIITAIAVISSSLSTAIDLIAATTYTLIALALFYLICVGIQVYTRNSKILRLPQDLEFSHTLSGLLFYIASGLLFVGFTQLHSASDYTSSTLIAAKLYMFYTMFIVFIPYHIAMTFFNMPAKGNEERRIADQE